MIYFEIRKYDEEIILSTIKKCPYINLLNENEKKSIASHQLRSDYKKFKQCTVWIISCDDRNTYNSSKLLKKIMDILSNLGDELLEYYVTRIKIHSHTLRSIQGKMKQTIDGLINEEDFSGSNSEEVKNKIAAIIETKIGKTASVLHQIKKRLIEVDAHVNGFEVLYLKSKKDINLREANIRKVIQSITTPYLRNFEQMDVAIRYDFSEEYANANKLNVDYSLCELIFLNFFQNALKYVKPNSTIIVDFEKNQDQFKLSISMESLRIEKEEISKLFELGYSGTHSGRFAGEGIGMAVIKKALHLMNMEMKIYPEYSKSSTVEGNKYVENHFIVQFAES